MKDRRKKRRSFCLLFLYKVNKLHNLVPHHTAAGNLFILLNLLIHLILIKLLNVDVLALLHSLKILRVVVKCYVGNELIYLKALKVGLLMLVPIELGIILLVEKIPESLLAVIPEKVVDSVASAGREVKVALLKGNIKAALHKEVLQLLVNHGNLAVILSEQAGTGLLAIHTVVNENIVNLCHTLCQSRRSTRPQKRKALDRMQAPYSSQKWF